ncbi:hypothetical protein [Oceanobacillus bengalensis]|uniref:Uncharacterized protein n=2 Tax=Oceanobacillus bengalensis TaxID=1435466 RepID=A0A494Z3F7_9BACI|nr:hypothetical protein D8M05_05130 [Oceanobacillus bengalensis]
MNINGMARGYMAKKLGGEDFLLHVGECVERQLKEWNDRYKVNIMKLADYEFVVIYEEKYYHVQLTKEEIELLQKQSPYALDREIWKELENQGLVIVRGVGNYIERVLY